MRDCHFAGTEFIGTNIRGTRFCNSIFENAIFQCVNADKVDFNGCKFYHYIFDGALGKAKNLEIDLEGNIIVSKNDIEIPDTVMKCAEDIIKNVGVRNTVIQMKNSRINRISLKM